MLLVVAFITLVFGCVQQSSTDTFDYKIVNETRAIPQAGGYVYLIIVTHEGVQYSLPLAKQQTYPENGPLIFYHPGTEHLWNQQDQKIELSQVCVGASCLLEYMNISFQAWRVEGDYKAIKEKCRVNVRLDIAANRDIGIYSECVFRSLGCADDIDCLFTKLRCLTLRDCYREYETLASSVVDYDDPRYCDTFDSRDDCITHVAYMKGESDYCGNIIDDAKRKKCGYWVQFYSQPYQVSVVETFRAATRALENNTVNGS